MVRSLRGFIKIVGEGLWLYGCWDIGRDYSMRSRYE